MSQSSIQLSSSLGYLLKEASSALRLAMETVLRPLGMTITHYSCLELLAQRPGLTNSELARGTFVTRQSMNVLLQRLEQEGIVARPLSAAAGRTLPAELTERGRKQLASSSAAVKQVEDAMLSGLSESARDQLRAHLRSCVGALGSIRSEPNDE